MRIAPSGQDIRFDEKQIEEGRNFATKLWNVARFRQMQNVAQVSNLRAETDGKLQTRATDLSIYAVETLARLNETIDAVDAAYREYQFNAVAQRLYDFIWSDYCDWFVEAAKTDIFGEDEAKKKSALAVMDFVLSAILRLLHPFMPHLTEELWSMFGFGQGSIQFEEPPKPFGLDADLTNKRLVVAAIYELVEAGRNLRGEARIPSNQKTRFVLRADLKEIAREQPTIARLLNASELIVDLNFQPAAGMPVATTSAGDVFLIVEVNRVAERDRLDKEIAKVENELRGVETKLKDKSFVERAPAAVVEEHRQRQKDSSARLAKLKAARERLS